jgi:hypothetical protein
VAVSRRTLRSWLGSDWRGLDRAGDDGYEFFTTNAEARFVLDQLAEKIEAKHAPKPAAAEAS